LAITLETDDEIIFNRALDDSRACVARIELLRTDEKMNDHLPGNDLICAIAEFELHGATLCSLNRWYPNEQRVKFALLEWRLLKARLDGI
jgi:hypothetical protein